MCHSSCQGLPHRVLRHSLCHCCSDCSEQQGYRRKFFANHTLTFSLRLSQYEISIKLEPNRDDAADPMVETVPRRHVEQPSITGRSTVPMNDPAYNSLPAVHYMDYNRSAQGGFGHAPAPNHNQVDIIRIRLGLDVRTTVSRSLSLCCGFPDIFLDHVAKHPQ